MRSMFVAFWALAVLFLTSCSEPHQETTSSPKSKSSSKQGPVESHGDAHAGAVKGDAVATTHGNEKANDHANHGISTDRHADDEHPTANNHGRHAKTHSAHGHTSAQHAGDDSKKIDIGDKVPDFEVTIDGKKRKFSELQKDVTLTEDGTLVLTFWCSFCHSCRHVEHPLDELAKQYQGKVGVLAVDASAGETTEGVAEFAKESEMTLPIALDSRGAAADIFGTRVTTTTVVIDKTGVLRYRGQFGNQKDPFAHDALQSVLAGRDVAVEETKQKG
jgi:thiol-disulfide isomerase/thioredoxin